MLGQRRLASYSLSSTLSSQYQNKSNELDATNNSRRSMSGRELKRLRLKRSAIISRQHLHRDTSRQAEELRQIPEDDSTLFQYRSHNRAIENIYMDLAVEDIYKEIQSHGIFFIFEDNDSSLAEGSSGTSATANSSSVDPDHELFVTELPSPTSSNNPHDFVSLSIDEMKKRNQASRSANGNVVNEVMKTNSNTMNTDATICSFITLDMLQVDNHDNFEQILKDYEDQRTEKFISTETKCNHNHDNELYSNPIQPSSVQDAESVHTSRSIDTFGFSRHEHIARDISKKNSSTSHCDASEKTTNTANSFECQTQPKSPQNNCVRYRIEQTTSSNADIRANSSTAVAENPSSSAFRRRMQKLKQNLDSLSNVDSFGFVVDDVAPPVSAPIAKDPSGDNAPISAAVDSSSQKEPKPKPRLRDQGHDITDEIRSVTSSIKYTQSSMLLSRARRLRTLRLRAAANNPNWEGDISRGRVKPFPTFGAAQVERIRSKSSDAPLIFADYSGQIIRVESDSGRHISGQSVISEISTQSERLLIKISPQLEAIMDDMNSFCGGIVIPDDNTCNSEDEYDKQMEYEEPKGQNVEDPPYDFDASVRTPPRCFFEPKAQAFYKRKHTASVFRKPCSGPLEWDDMSSIGLVDAGNNDPELKPPKGVSSKRQTRVNGNTPHDIGSCQKDSNHPIASSTSKTKEKQNIGMFRKLLCLVDDEGDDARSEASPTFSMLWGDGPSHVQEKPKGKDIDDNVPELTINHTFSTEEDDFASYYTGNSEEEIQNLEKDIFRSKQKATLSLKVNDSRTQPKAGRIVYSC